MAIYNSGSVSNYREYADHANFDVNDLTVACWIRVIAQQTARAKAVCRMPSSPANGDWELGTENANPSDNFMARVRLSNSTNYEVVASGTFSTSTWYHLAMRVDCSSGDTIKLYQDGTEVGSTALNAAATITASARAIRLFQATNGGSATTLDCELAELGIWNVALTADEITSLSKGFDPLLIRPSAHVLVDRGYTTGAKDLKLGLGTDTGTLASVAHPRVYRRKHRFVPKTAGGAAPPATTYRYFLSQSW